MTESRSELIHIRVKPSLKKRLEAEAQELHVTPSALARRVLALYFDED